MQFLFCPKPSVVACRLRVFQVWSVYKIFYDVFNYPQNTTGTRDTAELQVPNERVTQS